MRLLPDMLISVRVPSARFVLALALGLLVVPASGAQHDHTVEHAHDVEIVPLADGGWATADIVEVCRLPPTTDVGRGRLESVPFTPPRHDARTSTSFIVTYMGFTPQAQAAFEFALDIWASHVDTRIPIRMDATWAPLATNVLGSAGPRLFRDFPGAPEPGTWYAAALANELSGRDLDPTVSDMSATFNSSFPDWYFGLDGNVPTNQISFVSVVLHEIGHGLGFVGAMQVSGTVGTKRLQGFPFVYDRFTEDAAGRSLLFDSATYPDQSVALAQVLTSQVFWGGDLTVATHTQRPPLFTPAEWETGSSYNHLDEAAFPAGDVNALMTPRLARGEAALNPGPITCAMFGDMRWPLGPDCVAQVDEGGLPQPRPGLDDFDGPLSLTVFPNPVRSGGVITIRVQTVEEEAIRLRLFDTAGRMVRRASLATRRYGTFGIYDDVDFDTVGLASGVYYLVAFAESGRQTRPITIVR